jgi:hypothetical protein
VEERFPHISMNKSSFKKLKWTKVMEKVRLGGEGATGSKFEEVEGK